MPMAIGGRIRHNALRALAKGGSAVPSSRAASPHPAVLDGVFPSAIPKVNLLEPAFVVSVRDLIEGCSEDRAQLDGEWNEFEGIGSVASRQRP